MLKQRLLCLFFWGCIGMGTIQAQDTIPQSRPKPSSAASLRYLLQDSLRFARALEKQRVKDSVAIAKDSIAKVKYAWSIRYLKPLASDAKNQFLDSLKHIYIQKSAQAWVWSKKIQRLSTRDIGAPRVFRDAWMLIAVFLLLLFLATIRLFFMKDLLAIATSFYSSRALMQVSKEDNLITSWPFVFLYLLFGFTIGLFLYLYAYYHHLYTDYKGISLFITLSLATMVLFTLKLIITRAIGYVFGLKRLVRDYISILYLSYFNAALIFLPLLLILTLVPDSEVRNWTIVSCIVVILVFVMQFFRASGTVLKSYQFSKFYLFIYLCTLEVGPILILIKTLGI